MNRARIAIATATLILALPLAAAAQHHGMMPHHPHKAGKKAAADPVFVAYEKTRQAMIRGSVADIEKAARLLGDAAEDARQRKLATLAADLETAATLDAARDAFAAVSDEAIRYRNAAEGARPAVAWCSMEKKSWLQPVGKIGNPYVDDSMRTCGEFVGEEDEPAGGSHRH